MMLRVNDEYIFLPEPPQIVQQAKTADLLESAGDFSYQFGIPNTSENKRIIGITGFETLDVDAELMTNGETIFSGNLAIERVADKIYCSFSSGNSNWFAILGTQLVSDVPVEYTDHLKYPVVNTSPSALLVAAWANTSGIVFPLMDVGRLRNWDIARVDTGDFLPMVFLHEIMTAIFQSNGLKLAGDLLTDGRYKTLICGSAGGVSAAGSAENMKRYVDGYSISVGKIALQTINTVPQKVTFDQLTDPYYNGTFSPWNSSNQYVAGAEMDTAFRLSFTFATSVTYTVTLRKNGVIVGTLTDTADSIDDQLIPGGANLAPGDILEIWASVSAGSTAIDATSKMSVTFLSFDHYYPQFFLGPTTQKDFVKSVFTMFNVIASYDKYTKTVTCSLFEKISSRPPQDLSWYVKSYEVDYVEVLSDLAKDIIFKHQQGESTVEYNEVNDVPFAAGKISPDRRTLTGKKEIETIFTATKDYLNSRFRALLMDLGAIKFTTGDGEINIASVADDGGGIAVFTTTEDHGLHQLDYVTISQTTNGIYDGLGLVASVPTPTTFKISFLAYGSSSTGIVQTSRRDTAGAADVIYLASYVPNMLVSDFSEHTTINYSGTTYTRIAWAYFLKPGFDLPIDELRNTAAFGQDEGYFNITLLDAYYNTFRKSVIKPTKVKTEMLLPEKVYKALDFARPVILNTPDFQWRFYIQKNAGYIGSEYLCNVDLIRIP